MNFYEERMLALDRRVKRIAENPDPTMLQSNKMLFELERDLYTAEAQAWKEGKPFATGGRGSGLILRSMGFEMGGYTQAADRTGHPERYMDTVRRLGIPESSCDRTVIMIAMCVNGELPPPSLAVTGGGCDPVDYCYHWLANYYHIPLFPIDFPLDRTEQGVKYMADQLGELIEFVESRFPGMKYHEDKLLELQEVAAEADRISKEVFQLRKRVPFPMSGRDALRLPMLPIAHPDPAKALKHMRIWRDEVGERAEKGIGAVAEEKLRLMWTVTAPNFINPFAALEKRGVSIPVIMLANSAKLAGLKYFLYGDETEYGRKLSPLEEEGRDGIQLSWSGLGEQWVKDTLLVCRDLKIDAIVSFNQMGCTATAGLGNLIAEAARRELDLPTLQITGRQLAVDYFNQAEWDSTLNQFIDMCFARKGIS